MASPATKRRKIDPNMAQNNNGYPIELFIHQKHANDHLCVLCKGVCKQPYDIGCENEHIFCKTCLDNYFILTPTNSTKTCPSCQSQGLTKNNIRRSRLSEKLINKLNINCPLQLKQNEHCNVPFHNTVCEWTGELKQLTEHENICELVHVTCDHCLQNMKRFELAKHDTICDEKAVPCELCDKEIKRKFIQRHQNNKCPMKMLLCDCTETVLRKNMESHTLNDCVEYEIMCEFKQYGCNSKIKRKLMHNHLEKNEVKHWKMKVKFIEEENKTNKKIIEYNSKELEKVKITNETLIKQTKEQEIRIQTLETLHDDHKLLLLLSSNNAYITGIESGKKQRIKIGCFMSESHDRYCMGNNIGFNAAKQIGFDTKDVNIISNNIVFGLSEDQNIISALNLHSKTYKSFNGNLSINGYMPIYCNGNGNGNGLMVIGGERNNNIYKIKFNGNRFTKQILTELPYSTIQPSICMVNNNQLFVCGGFREDNHYGDVNLTECWVYSFNEDKWKECKNMNYEHQCAGICVWKERGNNIIVAGGHPDNKKVQEYDMHKDKWINLSSLKMKHEFYPALLTSNN
eukprot:501646_1